MLKRDWIAFTNINNYSTLNSEHNWEDLCVQSKNQQTYPSDNHNQIGVDPIFNPIFIDVSS